MVRKVGCTASRALGGLVSYERQLMVVERLPVLVVPPMPTGAEAPT